MNSALWERIEAFDLDHPVSEYGFSTRLANENLWTKNFTQKAITEYKKFMYLAATSGYMVSPSEIVDVVWHQHLIFTKSYAEFCKVLGKNIQHIPSTHNRDEATVFKQAKERTASFYNETFGPQPTDVWDCDSMLDALNLPSTKFSPATQITIALLLFIALLAPCYHLLLPVYRHINNPYFIIGYIIFFSAGLILLGWYNKKYLRNIVEAWQQAWFINNLDPLEVIYLKTGRLGSIMHGIVNDYIKENKLCIVDGKTISINSYEEEHTAEGYALISAVQGLQPVTYPVLIGQVIQKPVFANIALSMTELKRYFISSAAFARLLLLNLSVILLLLLPGTTRLITGIVRGKPVDIIGFAMLAAGIIVIIFIKNLIGRAFSDAITKLYKTSIIPAMAGGNSGHWGYFISGNDAISAALLPLVAITDNTQGAGGDSGGCGSSCGGGSCGSGCGGCGGD